MTPRSDVLVELEKALADEAYDGGLGVLDEEQFAKHVRRLAEVAAEVVKEELDARWEHSDHTAAKYYRRMRDVEREMHARELHHFEEEKLRAEAVAERDLYKAKSSRLADRIGNAIVAVQDGEPECVILGMLRGELVWDHNTARRVSADG